MKKKRIYLKIGIGLILAIVSSGIFIVYFLPLPKQFLAPTQIATTKIYDRNGKLLYEILNPKEGKKTIIPLTKLPKYLIQATLAAEDINYLQHSGIDIKAISRAIYLNFNQGRIVSGGSTLTQQLVRNILGVQLKRTYKNKVVELIYALRLNQLYSKEKILELYLNKIYYGNLAYGVESAALDYFGKHIYDLDLAEISIIAGLPQSPSTYNPFSNFKAAKKRQAYILDLMVKNKFISAEEAEGAKKEPLKLKKNKTDIKAPHFVHLIIRQLEDKYGEEKVHFGGLKVFTTLDLNWQLTAENLVSRQINLLAKNKVTNGAILSLDPKTNQVLTWVGSNDYFDETIDGAVDMLLSYRQPGSALKPFNYLLSFLKGYTPATTVTDIYTQFDTETGPYVPKNYDLKFHGLVRLRTSLASSLNVPAVKVLEYAGIESFMHFLEKFGIDTLNESPSYYGLALTLGGAEVQMKKLAESYSTLANFGEKRNLSFILKITDADGEVLEEWKLPKSEYILGEKGKQAAYQIIDILSDKNARLLGFGESSALSLSRKAAVKTGTTRNFKDNWAVGFTPNFLTLAWIGNADGTPMENVSGVSGAGPIWNTFMEEVLRTLPNEDFVKPAGLTEVEICEISGKLPTENCLEKIREIFIKGTEPKEYDEMWQKRTCDKRTSEQDERTNEGTREQNGPVLRPEDGTTQGKQECKEEYYIEYPAELRRWAWQEERMDMRTDAHATKGTIVSIASPLKGDSFKNEPSLPDEFEKIPFRVNVSPDIVQVIWNLNRREISKVNEFPFTYLWMPQAGNFTLEAIGINNNGEKFLSKKTEFEVVN